MKKQRVDKYAEAEILNGKNHQEVFDYIVSTSHFKIHDIAEIVRKIPTLEKRKKYAPMNLILLAVIVITILDKILIYFTNYNAGFTERETFGLLFPVINILLFYGIYKYKRNVHLWLAIFLLLSTVVNIIRLINQQDVIAFVGLLITLVGAVMAFYLSIKIVSDYTFNKELQKANPTQRENLISFTD